MNSNGSHAPLKSGDFNLKRITTPTKRMPIFGPASGKIISSGGAGLQGHDMQGLPAKVLLFVWIQCRPERCNVRRRDGSDFTGDGIPRMVIALNSKPVQIADHMALDTIP